MKDRWQRRAGRLFCTVVAVATVYLTLKYALAAILPFLAALAIGTAVFSAAKKSAFKRGGSRRAWALFYVAVFWLLLLTGASLIAKKLTAEAGEVIAFLGENSEDIGEKLKSAVDTVMELPSRIPALKSLENAGAEIKELSSNIVKAVVSRGGDMVAKAVGKMVMSTPSALLSVVVCVLASVYIALDLDRFRGYFAGTVSTETREKMSGLLRRIAQGIRGFGKAYFWLYALNFVQLYAGLWLLRVKYAAVIALGLAFFDVLPLFSAGVVLIPWGILRIASGDIYGGIGMMVLFAVMSVTRQVAEPIFVGKGLGLHPLATLVSTYVGFKLFGFWGMVLSPVVVLVIKETLENAKKEEKIGEKT